MIIPRHRWFLGLREVDTTRAILLGLLVAAIAIVLRLAVSADVGGEQAIFAYPAIILATLLVGARGGAVTAVLCMGALWFYVIPDKHGFQLANARAAITLLISVLVAGALIWAVSAMRSALFRYEDLTKQLEQRVRERTAERNRFWDLSQEMIAIVDADGRFVGTNPSFNALTSPEAQSGAFVDCIAAEDRSLYDDAKAALDGSEGGVLFAARVAGAAGMRHIVWSMVGDGGLFYLVGRDFTAEHQCKNQLLQAQKMELVGQITGGLAHDFGNVLTSVNVALHLMRKQAWAYPQIVALVDMAEQSAALGDALIARLLTFSRPGESRPETIPVGALLDDVVPFLRQSIGQRSLKVEIAENLPAVLVDRSQFEMALLNLSINARDATGLDDVLTLSARPGEDRAVDIVVADRGSGMDDDTLRHVAEPFFTTKGPGRGSGMGLPMVQNFTDNAGGRLSIESSPGKGTSVKISLPAAAC